MIQPTVSLDGRILGPTREEWPDRRIEIVDWVNNAPDKFEVHIEVATDRPETFTDLLDWDDTVCGYEHFGAVAGRHRYIVEYTPTLPDIRAHNSVVDNGGIPHRCYTLDDGSWMVELSFTDRHSFGLFRDRCDEIGLPISLQRLQTVQNPDRGEYGLTDRQQTALKTALDAGYFDYPQEATQKEVASQLNISRQAASELLHKGLWQVLTETVGAYADSDSE